MSWFSSPAKLWKIGKHRVKEVTVNKKESYMAHTGPMGSKERKTKTVPKTRYKCVDCERVLKSRKDFENGDYTCYDVIQQ